MAEGVDCDASCEVEVLAVLNIPYVGAFSFYEDWRWAGVGCDHEGGMFSD